MYEIDYLGRDGDGFNIKDPEEYARLNNQLRLESMDYWRLCDELSVVEAALLVVGEDPSTDNVHVENWDVPKRPIGYEAAKSAISRALIKGTITGNHIPEFDLDINGNICGEVPGTINVSLSSVDVDSLRSWLKSRGVHSGFFFPVASDKPDYLDQTHPRYAPKLAAAVNAWLEVGSSSANSGKSVKQSLMKWLRENASLYKLSDDDGKPNETGIEECAKVANWQDKGGAPKTPGG
jgi:hypothetical protein